MGSGDNSSSDISERLNIARVKDVYRSPNKDNYIQRMFKHNDQCTGLDIMEETLSYLALQGWYVVLATRLGNPPTVWVLTGGLVGFGSRPGQEPNLRWSWWVVTRPEHRTAGIWPG
jgi:hypothetical protein